MGIRNSPKTLRAFLALVLSFVLALTASCMPTLYKGKLAIGTANGYTNFQVGVWYTKVKVGCISTAGGALNRQRAGCSNYESNPADCGSFDTSFFDSNAMCCACGGGVGGTDPITENVDCSDISDASFCGQALKDKCGTMQAFGFLGMFCNVIGIVLLQISFRPIEATMAASGFASFSYMLIWSITAGLYNGEPGPGSNCGLGLSENEDASYGASFGLFIMCWLLTAVATVYAFLGASEGPQPYGGAQQQQAGPGVGLKTFASFGSN